MTLIAFFAGCLLGTLACCGQGIPADGQMQSFWLVEAEMPDTVAPGQFVSLADAAIVRRIDARYRLYGDTLASREADGSVTWFAIREEGVVMVGANNRAEQLALSEGALYLPAGLPELRGLCVDSVKVSPCGETPRVAGAGSLTTAAAAGGFVFADGDTVASTLMVRTAYADDFGAFESRRWYADGLTFPVVTVETLRAGGGELRLALVCPPSEQPSADAGPRRASRGGEKDNGWQRIWNQAFARGGGKIDYSRAIGELPKGARLDIGERICLSGACGAGDLSLVPLMVCDAAGRVLARGVGEAGLGRLPAGCYIAAFALGDKAYAIKFWIN